MKNLYLDFFLFFAVFLSALAMNFNFFSISGVKPNFVLIFLLLAISLKRNFFEFFLLAFFSVLILAWLPFFSRELVYFLIFISLLFFSKFFISFEKPFGFLFFLAFSPFLLYAFINSSFLLSSPGIIAFESALNILFGWPLFFFFKNNFSDV